MSVKTKAKALIKKAARRKIGPYTLPEIEKPVTHEKIVTAVYQLALQRPGLSNEERQTLREIKLVYGAGPSGTRGITYYHRWAKPCACGKPHGPAHKKTAKCEPERKLVPFVAVCGTAQESLVQAIGTTLHELGHVLAGLQAGHGDEWKAACAKLGLVNMLAAGTAYSWDTNFEDGDWLKALQTLPQITDDGEPANVDEMLQALHKLLGPNANLPWSMRPTKIKPCTAGWGARGGKSRTTIATMATGQGPKSRLLLWQCKCATPFKVRATAKNSAGMEFKATCGHCGAAFELVEDSLPLTRKPPESSAVPPASGGGH